VFCCSSGDCWRDPAEGRGDGGFSSARLVDSIVPVRVSHLARYLFFSSQFSRLGEVFALSLAWVYARIQFYCRNIDGENIDIASMFRVLGQTTRQKLSYISFVLFLQFFLCNIDTL
ncbi:Os01g0285200, partial [Oryza sativa Japonica Group]